MYIIPPENVYNKYVSSLFYCTVLRNLLNSYADSFTGCGNTANSVFRNYIFFGQLFFFYDAAKNNESFSFGCQRGRISNYRNSSALINNCGNFNVFFLVTYNKMENKQVIE